MEPEENVDEKLLLKQTAEHLWKIGNYLSSSCPSASRYYIFNLERQHLQTPNLLKHNTKSYQFCHHCGSIWSPDNCRIQLEKRQPINCHLKKLLNLEANQPWKLNNQQRKKLRKFRESTNKLVYSCFSCKKKTIHPGTKKSRYRSFSQPSSSTPISKLKLKKGDLNAGLFIPSPCTSQQHNLENPDIFEKIKVCETSLENTERSLSGNESPVNSKNESEILNRCTKKNVTPRTVKSTPELNVSSVEKQSTSKKRRKTLLAQILNQEQNKKKKTNLASFLVSL